VDVVGDATIGRETRLSRTIHAEMNAILNSSAPVLGATLYSVPFQPCDRCAVHIIQAGISRVVGIKSPPAVSDRWGIELGQEYFDEAEVVTKWYGPQPHHMYM